MEISIDCAAIFSREDLHRVFSEALCFPDWYGRNLDALSDQLTSLSASIQLKNWDIAQTRLGKYGLAAKKALCRAMEENSRLRILFV